MKRLKYNLIQGGMGIGISKGNLAGHVALCGAIGTISSVEIGCDREDYKKNPIKANIKALEEEIKKAKSISKGNGIIAMNIMVATQNYELMIKKAVEFGIELIISGAGLPMNLPELAKNVMIAPIVSSKKAFDLIVKIWKRKYNRTPDLVVVEGPKAGGHLGFKNDEIDDENITVLSILKSIRATTKIPLYCAGGIDNKDIKELFKNGADGVQIATPFIATEECDADIGFKEMIVNSKDEDVVVIKSPVGMPARAINNKFVQEMMAVDRIPPTRCVNCLKTCDPRTTKYCIREALINAFKGDKDKGLFFAGTNLKRSKKIVKVKELIEELFR